MVFFFFFPKSLVFPHHSCFLGHLPYKLLCLRVCLYWPQAETGGCLNSPEDEVQTQAPSPRLSKITVLTLDWESELKFSFWFKKAFDSPGGVNVIKRTWGSILKVTSLVDEHLSVSDLRLLIFLWVGTLWSCQVEGISLPAHFLVTWVCLCPRVHSSGSPQRWEAERAVSIRGQTGLPASSWRHLRWDESGPGLSAPLPKPSYLRVFPTGF